MSFDDHANFAYSQVVTAPSPATSGTSLVVQSSDGAKFPTVPFNAVVWAASANPLTSNAEIVRVTVVSGDTFTITRAQESSSARTVAVGDQIMAAVTAKTLTDIEANALTEGTSFPVSPNDGDWFYRSDRRVTYTYDASLTRWLSTDLKYISFTGPSQVEGTTSIAGAIGRLPLFEDWYIEKWVTYTNILTTNNGSNYYTFSLQNEATVITSIDTAGDTVAAPTIHTSTVNQFFTSGTALQVATNKVGSPGAHYVASLITFRTAG